MIDNDADTDLIARIVAALEQTESMQFLKQLMSDPGLMRTFLAANDPEYAAEQERLKEMENQDMNGQPEMLEEEVLEMEDEQRPGTQPPVRNRKQVRRSRPTSQPVRRHMGQPARYEHLHEETDQHEELEGDEERRQEHELGEQEMEEEEFIDPEIEGTLEEEPHQYARGERMHQEENTGERHEELEGDEEEHREGEVGEQEEEEEEYIDPEMEGEAEEEEEVTRHERYAKTQMAGGILPKTKLAPPRFQQRPMGIPSKPTSNIPMKPSFEPTKPAKRARTEMAPPSIRAHGLPEPKKPTTNVPRSTRMQGVTSAADRAEGHQARAGQRRAFDESWGRRLHEVEPTHFDKNGQPVRNAKHIANIQADEYELEGGEHEHPPNIEADEYEFHDETPANIKAQDFKLQKSGRPVRRAAMPTGGATASGSNTYIPGGVGSSPQSNYEREEADRYKNPAEIPQMIHNRKRVRHMRTQTVDTTPQEMLSYEEIMALQDRLDRALNENDSLRTQMARMEHNQGILVRNARSRAIRERLARRRGDLQQLQSEGVMLDVAYEMGEPGEGDAYLLNEGQWERKVTGMRKHYQRAPVSGSLPFRTDLVRDPSMPKPDNRMADKNAMYAAVDRAKTANGYDPSLYAAAVNGAGSQQ